MEKTISNLHMERIKCQQEIRFIVEEEKSITDQRIRPDYIMAEDGHVVITEINSGKDMAEAAGILHYQAVYKSKELQEEYSCFAGQIEWKEKMEFPGLEHTDQPEMAATVESIKISLTQGKLKIKAVLKLSGKVREIYDEQVICGFNGTEVEIQTEKRNTSVLMVDRREKIKIREEIELPREYPVIGSLLFNSVELRKWESKSLDERIALQTELEVFILYNSFGREEMYKEILSVNTNLDCSDCRSYMEEVILPNILEKNISVKQDEDGEDRILLVEMVIDLPIKLYEQREMEEITDVYGIREEITPIYRKGIHTLIMPKQQMKVKPSKIIQIPASAPEILELMMIRPYGLTLSYDEKEMVIIGKSSLHLFYRTQREEEACYCVKDEIEFTVKPEESKELLRYHMMGTFTEAKAVLLDDRKLEIKTTVLIDVISQKTEEKMYLADIECKEADRRERKTIPAMAIYRATEEERLWDIGKVYRIPVSSIKEINQLEKDTIMGGEKILLIK